MLVDGTIQADRGRLRGLFENLYQNPVDHGGPDTNLRVERIDSGVVIEDDGPGISKAKREDVFELGHSSSADGIGLGLSIVREIVEVHGWKIQLTSSHP